MENYPINHCYLVTVLVMCAICAASFGANVVITDELNAIYTVRMPGYDGDKDETVFTSITVAGLMCGSLVSDFAASRGRRLAILLGSLVGMVGGGLMLTLSYWPVLIGKFISGFASGILISAGAMFLNETIPV